MAEQIGIVIENEMDGLARVVTDRKGACGGCDSGTSKCRSCLTTSGKLESHVFNPINAGVGDVVKISISQANLFKGVAIMYLLPIATLILGAVGGLWLGGPPGSGDSGSVLGGLTGLVFGLWAVTRLGRSRRLSRKMTPTITEIVTASDNSMKKLHPSCCG